MAYNKSFVFSCDFYDLFYQDKNYEQESSYIVHDILKLNPQAKNLLELGCGSGNYSRWFSKQGFNIVGVDSSAHMLEMAAQKQIPNFSTVQANIADFELAEKFDVCVALFDVLSYLTESEDLLACFHHVNAHLEDGGYFIFDVWNSGGVYADPPRTNTKTVKTTTETIVRTSESNVDFKTNVVEVMHTYKFYDEDETLCHQQTEAHFMRHFCFQEIAFFAKLANFTIVKVEEPFGRAALSDKSWKACYTLKK
ncbi:MAG: class I SAM-dependent methyltransferase [Edaphocola sp.]